MSYSANKYNYATPPLNTGGVVEDISTVVDRKYFTLFDNKLDGNYSVISDNVGIWGASLSDADGVLAEPFIITVEETRLYVNAFRLTGSAYCYPVSFTVKFYNGDTFVHEIVEDNNTSVEALYYLQSTIRCTKYVVTVTKISEASNVARIYNAYNPGYVRRKDALKLNHTYTNVQSQKHGVFNADALRITTKHRTHIHNTINPTKDTLEVKQSAVATPTNIHTVMKEPFRQIFGKVYITYTDPMLDDETIVTADSFAYNSNKEQILDGIVDAAESQFTLYNNDLTGKFLLTDSHSQVGWVSSELSLADGTFVKDPSLTVSFAARPVISLVVTFDSSNVVRDFTVSFTLADGFVMSHTYTDNVEKQVVIVEDVNLARMPLEAIAEVVSVTLTVHKVTKPDSPAIIIDMPLSSTILYKGYADVSDLISIDLLEELTYEDEIEALGGVSANEVTVVLDNSDREFFFNSNTIVSKQLKRNRKIVPWLGAEIVPGETEWYTLGTFWSYKWDVPVNSLTASVVAFDTLGLLDTTDFTNHHVQINKSIGELIEYVLGDARQTLSFIEYLIDPSLYDIFIPYAWFARSSHTAALRKISLCYPLHIYCDRQGRICAMPQKLHLDYYYDVWAENTNVVDTKYSSLYTTLPNIINVTVSVPAIKLGENLVQDNTVFSVSPGDSKMLDFNKPYLNNISVNVEGNVKYSYEVYSWGIYIFFEDDGEVRSITCTGDCVDTSTKSLVNRRNEASIRLNGSVTREVNSDFIQTYDLADLIINRLMSLSENDKYDATVEYRGDISLTINDPILLQDGIAPDNRYNLKRHQLSWNGSLTGSADLNT